MQESKYLLFFIGALGAFNGLILGIYFLFMAKKKNLSSVFLGCLLAALSLRIGKSVYVYFAHPNYCRTYLQIGLSACMLIGPALLFFIKASIQQPAHLPRNWRRQIIALVSVIAIVGILYPYAVYVKLWNVYFIKFIYALWIAYVMAAGVSLRGLFTRIGSRFRPLTSPEKWLLAIYGANVFICASFVMSLFVNSSDLYYSGAVIFSFVLYIMIFVHIYQGKIAGHFYLAPAKNAGKELNNASELVQTLGQVMNDAEPFKNANLTLAELAKLVGISGHQLSQLLNDHMGKNFTSYVNEYRIKEACRMIGDAHPFTLEAIGYEVGFNSKSTFYTAFKKQTGTTPLLYKASLVKNHKKIKTSLSAE
jgi:AraC-like DNA-binding protein